MTTFELDKKDELRWWSGAAKGFLTSFFVHIWQIENLKLPDDFDEWLKEEHPNQIIDYNEWKHDKGFVVGRTGDE